MPWNGSGTFNRIYSWVADKAAGLDITASRMDTDTDDITANGFGNSLTRDGQGQPTANLPMNSFRHTGVQNAVSRSDYAAFGQVQDGLPNWTVAGGTADALTGILTPALTVLNDGQLIFLRATAANATTTPTFAPNGFTAEVITKLGGQPLGIGDIAGALAETILRYNVANTRWELMNPSGISNNTLINSISTGVVWLTVASSAPTGWLMFNDGSMGSATSGANYQDNANLALFNMLFAGPFTDATCPLQTSTGVSTTRAAQGSAAAAWAANCRMVLPKVLGRALAVAGAGSGLTARTMGLTVGGETVTLAQTNLPSVNFAVTSPTITVAVSGTPAGGIINFGATPAVSSVAGGAVVVYQSSAFGQIVASASAQTAASGGSGSALSIMPPEQFMNAIVKQ